MFKNYRVKGSISETRSAYRITDTDTITVVPDEPRRYKLVSAEFEGGVEIELIVPIHDEEGRPLSGDFIAEAMIENGAYCLFREDVVLNHIHPEPNTK